MTIHFQHHNEYNQEAAPSAFSAQGLSRSYEPVERVCLDSSMPRGLCQVCLNLRWDLLERYKVGPRVFDEDRRSHYIDYEELTASTQYGCLVCGLLFHALESFCHCVDCGSVRIIARRKNSACQDFEPLEMEIFPYSLWLMRSKLIPPGRRQERVILQFYREQDTPIRLPIGQARTIAKHANSDQCRALLHNWFSQCRLSHDECSDPSDPRLPTRVIAVGSAESSPYLQLSKGESGMYTILSHCWGHIVPLQTTSVNVADHQREIREETLPQTFRDALNIARHLGIPFLWIDSLCILQDDRDDWSRESERMGSYHANALLTIAADDAANSSEGCFTHRPRNAWSPLRIEGQRFGVAGDVFVRSVPTRNDEQDGKNDPGHFFEHSPDKEEDNGQEVPSVPESRLMKRAWAYQEWALPRRIIHFSGRELVWECERTVCCECTIDATRERHNPIRRQSQPWLRAKGYPDALGRWGDLVAQVTRRGLTFETDILPSISGLAEIMSKDLGSGYACGVWMSEPLSLLWEPLRIHGSVRRQAKYYAPSWSWASITGPISLDIQAGYDDIERIERAEILSIDWERSSPNVYGPAKWAKLRVQGSTFAAKYVKHTYENHHSLDDFVIQGHLESESVTFDLDFPPLPTESASSRGEIPEPEEINRVRPDLELGDEVLVLIVGKVWARGYDDMDPCHWKGLVLRFTDEASSTYRRVGTYGVFCGNPESPVRTVSETRVINLV